MFNFFKRKSPRYNEVPEWAGFFSLDDFNTFIERNEINFNKYNSDIDVNTGSMEVAEVFGKGYQLGLHNLASVCSHYNKGKWKNIIRDHFNNICKGQESEKELSNIINDFSAISHKRGRYNCFNEYTDVSCEWDV